MENKMSTEKSDLKLYVFLRANIDKDTVIKKIANILDMMG